MNRPDSLKLRGVRENNLKNLALEIPHNSFTVVTGVSGSGKSTLAFDTIYAEGGRRYIETFSPYTRQFLDRLHKPALDSIQGVRPALALEQANKTLNSRSTVGTVTEINEYLKVVWSHLSTVVCPNCSKPVVRDTPARVLSEIEISLKRKAAEHILIAFPIHLSGQASNEALRATLGGQGFLRYFNRSTKSVEALESLDDNGKQDDTLLVVLDRISCGENTLSSAQRSRILGSIEQSYLYGHNRISILLSAPSESLPAFSELSFSNMLSCSSCEAKFPQPRSSMFSFNSPIGACKTCRGFGSVLKVDPKLCIPNPSLCIDAGAIACWSTKSTRFESKKLRTFCSQQKIDSAKPWCDLSAKQRDIIFHGTKGFRGIEGWFKRLQRKQYKMHVRVFLSRYRRQFRCDDCEGTRLIKTSLLYSIDNRSLPSIWEMPLDEALAFFENLYQKHRGQPLTETALSEVVSRLSYLVAIGLGYLTLDRQTKTLSGGEYQRVNLTAILGARLVNTTLVLDEPTIGLHAVDTERLIGSIRQLQDRGNTLIVVEHDADVIRAAEQVVDLGPGAGTHGGNIVYHGNLQGLELCSASLTGQYLSKARSFDPPNIKPKQKNTKKDKLRLIEIVGACAHNLNNLTVRIPLDQFVVLTGVSGSGKSSLVSKCFHEPYRRLAQGMTSASVTNDPGTCISALHGCNVLDDIVFVDQSPVGKTPRSNPATYTKAWDILRECLANTSAAQDLGLSKSAFSFNVDGGRCPDCKGAGYHRVEMQFLADAFVTCESCGGGRFQDKVLTVRYYGKNVVDLLSMSLGDVADFLKNVGEDKKAEEALRRMQPLLQLGLDYLTLGHPLNKLSGGEAQRIKLASFLGSSSDKQCLFILDEPTTGLHPNNIAQLLNTFRALIERGHSVLCIEHNLDVIRHADWMIDLGPGGGRDGGSLIAEGVPRELLKNKSALKTSQTLRALAGESCFSENNSNKKKLCNSEVNTTTKNRSESQSINVLGARQHNLKNISTTVPHGQLTVITGVSGSGKSTLAFDIIFAEGQRRYIDCLSPYARQYMKQLQRADVDVVSSLPPTIAVSQKTAPPLGLSTIATTTELYQYLRLLYSKVGTQHCPEHNLPIQGASSEILTQEIIERFRGKHIYLFAPVVSGRKGHYHELFQRALRAELTEARIDGAIKSVSTELRLERHKLHWIALLIASLSSPERNRELLESAVAQALLLGGGTLEIAVESKKAEPIIFSTERVCPKCKKGFRELDPQDFSFRSKRGVCSCCGGHGVVGRAEHSQKVCPDCHGSRIGNIGRNVYISDKNIHELALLTAPQLLSFLEGLEFDSRLDPVVEPIVSELKHRLSVIRDVGLDYLSLDRDSSSISGGEAQRLRLAKSLGSPLTGVCYVLDEPTIGLHATDHNQLMRLLAQLRDAGNTVIVVEHDEDTIRAADHVIDIGPRGGAQGGEIVVAGSVEQLLKSADSQTAQALRERTDKIFEPLSTRTRVCAPEVIDGPAKSITIYGASANNLRNVTAEIPLGRFTVVAGVSGAGKSSLVHGSLVPAVIADFEGKKKNKKSAHKTWAAIEGLESLERILEIDQTPIGKTPASTPASYLGIFDDIRKIYAMVPEAEARGWNASHFSFNTGGGRCEECHGRGYIRIPMSFLPDALTLCETCEGLRYNEQSLEIQFQGISIGELLQKTMSEAREIFANHRKVRRVLDYVHELGLGYLTLGQSSNTLSGGEAQRMKIARELGSREAVDTLYILDEPTIGLHMVDVEKLLNVLQKLLTRGNSIVVIEHNLDVIRAADNLIEMGPGPGERGGTIVFSGPPGSLIGASISTPTKFALESEINKEKKVSGPLRPEKLSSPSSRKKDKTLPSSSQSNGKAKLPSRAKANRLTPQ